jgi:hypothetical protein
VSLAVLGWTGLIETVLGLALLRERMKQPARKRPRGW